MKIIAFAQMHNEFEKGNLENWFSCLTFCDYIYIYDQGSTDDSKKIYSKHSNVVLLESQVNNFKNEIICKDKLLKKLLSDHPDVDWVFWMDGDTLLDGRILRDIPAFHDVLDAAKLKGADSCSLGHYNLWRSDIHYRIDNHYHDLNSGVTCFWRNTGNLKFNVTSGLHTRQFPLFNSTLKLEYSLIHRGFATDFQIMKKYDTYKSFGQSGHNLERLLDERTLNVNVIPYEILPDWFKVVDSTDPRTKEKIRNIYNRIHKT